MKKSALILGAALSLVSASAFAGPCTDRIATLEKTLSTSDAGSGPTNSTAARTTAPDAGVPKAGETPGTGGTAGMNATVGDKATSPADVRAQTSGGATAAQGGASSAMQVSAAMSRAKAADTSGDAAACSKALDEAEQLMKG
ncbi:hypothetical protein MWN33_04415 [Starkeya koreensis]|uniref:Exopolysaccharide production protein YjbE n=1 Tax=Ancylobacter koreensis TaxID=266121 RepID=A0ABT0DJA0_9HYPH|nr:hypothetical protein [Ancylobacter koreensis]MCK0207274.1 hypothetical protein [Ancylobacter koreensis]